MPRQLLASGYLRVRWTACALAIPVSALAFGACATQNAALTEAPPAAEKHRSYPAKLPPQAGTDGLSAQDAQIPTPAEKPRVDIDPALQAASAILDGALTSSGQRLSAWWTPLSEQPHYSELLDPERKIEYTLSTGSVGAGELLNAREFQHDGAHHSVIDRHRGRGTHFATGAMIELILDAARQVDERVAGPKLRVGNMSLRRGGSMRWSRSHTSGRDADLAFYCKDKKTGERVLAPDLLRFDATGQAIGHPNIEFDTERNWELVQALLSHPTVDIQWLFISNPLKDILLHYARSQNADADLIARASKVLHQPTDALPHDDHLHLRITCPEQDRLEGCLDYGPRWEWVDWHYDALRARSLAIAAAFESPDASTRHSALDLLERIRSPYAPVLALSQARREPSDAVRLRALEVATNIPTESGAAVVEALKFVAQSDFNLDEKAYAYRLLRRAVDPFSLDPLKDIITASDVSPAEQRLAADALAHYMDPELVPFLLTQLQTQPAGVAEKLAVLLRRITNHSEDVDWSLLGMQSDSKEREAALSRWQDWWQANQARPREEWLAEGFSTQGLASAQGQPLDLEAVDALIAMLGSAPDHIAYNANLELKRITGRWAPLEAWDNARLQKYWARWWKWWQANHPKDLLASR